MDYKTYKPQPDLSAFVKCYWSLDAPASTAPVKQRIIPDGCIEMIFHYGGLFSQYMPDGSSIIQPRCFVFGQITRPLEIAPTGAAGIFAVCFYPHGFRPFAALPMADMENTAVPLERLFGEGGAVLEKAILDAATSEDRIKQAEAFLLARLATPESVDRIVKSGIAAINELNGQLSIADLSAHVKVNRRQLERKFSAAVGLSPKQLSKMVRIQFALKRLLHEQSPNLTDVAYESDYYDQAHFIKDFREFTGLSPKEFFAGSLKMSALFAGPA